MSTLVVPNIGALKQYINSEVGVSEYLDVSQENITRFAETTRDWQWIHTNVERATRESPFGGTVAHGFLILSFLSYFLALTVEVQGTKLMVNCGLNSVRFIDPVRAAARIRARVRLKECRDDQGFAQATWRMTIECEGNRFPACVADWIVRYYE